MPDQLQNDDLVMSLCELALARPPEHREAYLRSACSSDPRLFERIWNYVQWEERMNGFLLEPLYPPVSSEDPFEPGQTLVNRFRIVRKVGEGGMALVYEAFDERLDRRIAIKCAKTGFHKRLPPEVRHASEISHPNVCKIFEIHTASTDHGEIDFLTMEFLEGLTLAERLLEGALPDEQARTIAQQLCAGLAEAHRNQVIHGDLKSNNVILAREADGAVRAVITDFGLARRPGVQQPAGQSGEVAGALAYMAPELLKGEKPSAASDIYALGVVLYELVSGRKPFSGEVSWEERLTRPPAPLKHRWSRVLARCLHPDLARRFRTVDEVTQVIWPPAWRRWLVGSAAAAAALAIGTGIATYQEATAPQEPVKLAMLPIEGGSDLSTVAASMSRGAADQLGRLTGDKRVKLSVFSLRNAPFDNVNAVANARATLGATHVLRATLARENGKLVLHAHLTDTRSGVSVRDWTAEYAPGDERYAPVALAGFVTGTLQLPPLAIGPVNAAARQDYVTGLDYMRRSSTIDPAVEMLKRAAAADSDSPLTHAALAEANYYEYYRGGERVWLDRARDALRQAENRYPDIAAAHRAAGYLYYADDSYPQAEPEFERAIQLDPDNAAAHIWLGKTYEENNQHEKALAEFERATRAEPDYFRAWQNLGAYYLQRSKFDEAAKYHKKAVDLAPEEPGLHSNLATAYMNLGRFQDAEEENRKDISLKDTTTVEHRLGVTLLYERKDLDAVGHFEQALKLNSWTSGFRKSLVLMYLGIAQRRLKQLEEAKRVNLQGLEVAEEDMHSSPRDGYREAFVAYFNAALGHRRDAENYISSALGLFPDDSDTRWSAALTYEELYRQSGDPNLRQRTLDVLSRSTADQVWDLNRWPDLADLQADPRFKYLLDSHPLR